MSKYIFTIFDYKWTIYLLEKDKFDKKFGANTEGITDLEKNRIYINKESFKQSVIAHELTHLYFYYFGAEALQLRKWQIEEFTCELTSLHSANINKRAKLLYNKLKKGK